MTFMGAIQIVFIVLKLCAVIDWSWWLVMLPLMVWFVAFCFCCWYNSLEQVTRRARRGRKW